MKQLPSAKGRDIRFECVDRPFDFVSPFGGREFVLMLMVNDSTVTSAEQVMLSDRIVQQGCRFAVCAGDDCSTWDTSIDGAFLATDPDFNPPDERWVMTSWHDDDTIEDIVFFFLNNTGFDDFRAERFLIFFLGANATIEADVIQVMKCLD